MRPYKDEELYKTLKELEIISPIRLDQALEEIRTSKKDLATALLDNNLISEEVVGKVIAEMLDMDFVNLSDQIIPKSILKIVPEAVAQKQLVVTFAKDTKGVHIAMADPTNTQMVEFIQKKVGLPVVVYYARDEDIKNALSLYKKDVSKAFDEIIDESVKAAKGTKTDPSIINIVDTIITYAFDSKASDVHIEPTDEYSLVRFRIDGILHDVVNLPVELHPQVVTRIKVLAQLRTDEHQAAQDGKIRYEMDKEDLDIRVSIVPITDGEKIVMRLLSERSRQFSLVDLGFSQSDLEKVRLAYDRPHGMILATGPTGSGKTTTLYSILKMINKRDVNIMTIEDPVEYDIDGVNQIQVNTKTELTFAKGLRSIVRQDPDIVLVGEIRDEETADISVNAAMTGHLVLSTLHTNDAATAIPRLIDLKVEPFLIGSTVSIIIAQRLVRKICISCKVSVELNDLKKELKVLKDQGITTEMNSIAIELLNKYFDEETVRVYRGKGCKVCHSTGYSGRVGIFETLIVDDAIREAIIERKDAEAIRTIAIQSGMRTMVENGLEKVKNGETTIEEIMRVTKE